MDSDVMVNVMSMAPNMAISPSVFNRHGGYSQSAKKKSGAQ